jgi:hypothetical protein
VLNGAFFVFMGMLGFSTRKNNNNTWVDLGLSCLSEDIMVL